MTGPFSPDDPQAYARWRDQKLAAHPARIEELIVEVRDPRSLSASERQAILDRCARANMALYVSACGADPDKDIPRRLGAQVGLHHVDANFLADDDGISPLAVAGAGTRTEFVPYTSKPIRWHTDGYYNALDRQVQGMLLHCVRDAERGGDNQLLDHEIAYIQLRDLDPEYIRALMAPDAMTIPPRIVEGASLRPHAGDETRPLYPGGVPAALGRPGGGEARPAQPGPVFSVDAAGFLHMRYTARTVSIAWKQDEATRAAVGALEGILSGANPCALRARLLPGMGLVCNNVLHDRSGFEDSPAHRRLLYRARYFDRVSAA
ncbi:MAG: TauD/TfdA family dioxygenase [Betaproteobacteria bacterium]|nr:TauD/TfdA family dioxygenase [Betaproteobacteria bacterium]